MTKSQIILAATIWNKTRKHLQESDPNLDKKDLETERQDLLKLAGSKPDDAGRFSFKTLSNSGLSTFLDLCETTLGGQPNAKRRSNTLKWCLNNIKIPGIDNKTAYLNAISVDRFNVPDWQKLDCKSLKFLLWTAKNRARSRTA